MEVKKFARYILTHKFFKSGLKLVITGTAIFIVFHIIDFKQFIYYLKNIKVLYFILGLVVFNISKIVSSVRLQRFYRCIGVFLSQKINLRLYYVGMFYNLFLPGSVGGDGYKVFLLKGQSSAKVKDLITATLMDRISGAVILLSFSCLIMIMVIPALSPSHAQLYSLAVLFLSIIVIGFYYFFLKLLLPAFINGFIYTTWLSILVQAGQVLTAFFLLLSLKIESFYWEYLFLFMISSLAAVLPFTIGGVGAREFVFLLGFKYLEVDKNISIAFTTIFFMVLAFSALIGLFFSFDIDNRLINDKNNLNLDCPGSLQGTNT